jgi:hypothetical protein
MEVFMKKKVVFEVGILLKLALLAIDGSIPIFVSRKKGDAAEGKFLSNDVHGQEFARAGGVFNGKIFSVVAVKFLQRFHDQKVDRKPDRASPI